MNQHRARDTGRFLRKRRVVTGESWPQSRQLMIYETRRFGALFVPVCTTSPSILFRWTSFSKYISSSPTANRRLPSKEISAVVKEGINGFRAVVSCRKVTAIVFFFPLHPGPFFVSCPPPLPVVAVGFSTTGSNENIHRPAIMLLVLRNTPLLRQASASADESVKRQLTTFFSGHRDETRTRKRKKSLAADDGFVFTSVRMYGLRLIGLRS